MPKHLSNIDLQRNELRLAVVHPLATDPAPPSVEGQIYYDTATDLLKVYDGTTWNAVGTSYTAGTGIGISGGTISLATGGITDTHINSSAAISHSKLANATAGYILQANASGVITATAVSGDVTISSSGVTAIASGVIVNADVNASAAIAYSKLNLSSSIVNADVSSSAAIAVSKLAAGTSAQILLNNSTPAPTWTTVSGDVTISNTGVTNIASGAIVNADINASAAIALSKLATDPLARANHTGTQTSSTISDLAATVKAYRLDEFANPTASVSLNSQKITNLADGTSAGDAVNLGQLQSIQAGLDPHGSVRVATTTNITTSTDLNSGDVIDGVTLANGDRVLVKDQSTKSQNGIWVVAASPSRATDADAAGELSGGSYVFVEEGTANADTGWVITTNGSITPGTTAHDWAIFSRAGALTGGTGITVSGNTISIDTAVVPRLNVDNTFSGNLIASKATTGSNPVVSGTTSSSGIGVLGSSSSGAGVVATSSSGPAFQVQTGHGSGAAFDGNNEGAIVNISDGTNDDDAATVGQVKTIKRWSGAVPSGATPVLTHNLGTRDVIVSIREVGSPYAQIEVDNEATSTNTVTLKPSASMAGSTYQATILAA